MATDNLLSLGAGILLLIAGTLFIVRRVGIAKFFASFYRVSDSKLAVGVERKTSPGMMLTVGVIALLVGLGSIAMGIWRHHW